MIRIFQYKLNQKGKIISGWGTHYFNNGNQAQGAVKNGTFDGQGLHYRWVNFEYFLCTYIF